MAFPAQLTSMREVERGLVGGDSPSVPLPGDGESGKLENARPTSSDSEAAQKQEDAVSSPQGARSRGLHDGDGGIVSKVVSRVLTRASTIKSNWDPGVPPDGGMKAWAVGKFLLPACN